MNTERRHELGENELAKEINVVGEKIREHGSTVAMILGVGLILYALAAMWNSRRATLDQNAWDAYQAAMMEGDPELRELRRVAESDEFTGSAMQEWAYVAWADRQLLLASQQYFFNRDAANKRLSDVAAVYEQFATGGTDPEIRNRARLGLARVDEMQNRLDAARKDYGMVEGALGEYASRRAKVLESKAVEEDYKWLVSAELPKAPASRGPGAPGLRPGFEASAPNVDGNTDSPIDSASSLEDILGKLGETPEDEQRYDGETEGAATPAAAADETLTDEAKDAATAPKE